MEEWLGYPRFCGYAVLRNMSGLDWTVSHDCLVCSQSQHIKQNSLDPWRSISGALSHFATCPQCLGGMLSELSPDLARKCLVPTTWELLTKDHLNMCTRSFLSPISILYIGRGGHRECLKELK